MPYDKATQDKPYLSSEEALDLAAFINDDEYINAQLWKNFSIRILKKKLLIMTGGLLMILFLKHSISMDHFNL